MIDWRKFDSKKSEEKDSPSWNYSMTARMYPRWENPSICDLEGSAVEYIKLAPVSPNRPSVLNKANSAQEMHQELRIATSLIRYETWILTAFSYQSNQEE